MQHRWTSTQIPDLTGKNAVVTGAGRELGQLIIRRLTAHGAHVFAISRDKIAREAFDDDADFVHMIPTNMGSIQRGADRIRELADHVDILIHAASISVAPRFRSREGHDLMFATNYLGFVMLTHELSPAMRNSKAPRVVLAGSGEPIDMDLELDKLDADMDLPWHVAYVQSRIAAMLFTLELSHRNRNGQSSLISTVAEARERDRMALAHHPLRRHVHEFTSWVSREPEDAPAAPVLFASTSDEAEGGNYYAPRSRGRLRGDPLPEKFGSASKSLDLRSDLWQRTEDILGIHLDVA